jgi:hypothetical protein
MIGSCGLAVVLESEFGFLSFKMNIPVICRNSEIISMAYECKTPEFLIKIEYRGLCASASYIQIRSALFEGHKDLRTLASFFLWRPYISKLLGLDCNNIVEMMRTGHSK